MRIVVVGGGPKALAIYTKAKALSEAGFKVPEIHIIEKAEIGANWCGNHGFTDGSPSLGTPPEKDIGFPYDSEYKNWKVTGARNIDQFLFKYSWPSYKISRQNYADWLDRSRPAPRHSEWAAYLQWVAGKLDLGSNLCRGIVTAIRKKGRQWVVQHAADDIPDALTQEIVCDGIVFTGPGEPKRILEQSTHEMVLDGQNFWEARNLDHIRYRFRAHSKRIAVIGAGETAASVTSALLKMTDSDEWSIDMISRRGTLYSRGEGYHENKPFSNPAGWELLHSSLRAELIDRTDRGVLSLRAIEVITEAKNVSFLHGEVVRISSNGIKAILTLKRLTEAGEQLTVLDEYDCVIVALGFDPLGFCSYFKEADLGPHFQGADGDRRKREFYNRCAKAITSDLSVTGLEPRLYLPMLAGLMQGPGFPNLSCLGALSDRILRYSIQTLNPRCRP